MKKNFLIVAEIMIVISAIVSIISIVLNNPIAYPICFNLALVLWVIIFVGIVIKSKDQMKTYEIKHLKLNLTEILIALGTILIVGSPLLQKYFELIIFSYILVAIGLALATLGLYLEYYLFNFVFKRKECIEV